jgi:hypothetical protein
MTTTINASTSSGLVNTADTSGILQLQTASTAALTIDASQNVGIGVTPSAGSGRPNFNVGGAGVGLVGTTGNIDLVSSAYYASGWKNGDASYKPTRIDISDGVFSWNTGSVAAVGTAITWTTPMTLSAAGYLGIGTTNPSYKVHAVGSGSPQIVVSDGTTSDCFIYAGVSSGVARIGPDTGALALYTAGSERMRIDSSGIVGIGTTTPSNYSSRFSVNGNSTARMMNIDNAGANGVSVGFSNNGTDVGFLGSAKWVTNGTLTDFAIGSINSLIFSQNGNERARIDGSGSLLVGRTAQTPYTNTGFCVTSSGRTEITRVTGGDAIAFYVSASGNNVGTIVTNASSTSYNTSSDYRLKENIVPMTGALAKVAQLKPVTYKWKADGSDGEGFIAHELAEVKPDCVSGDKDGVEIYKDEDGNEQTRPKYQGIDTSFLVATLTAAIQELKAINDTQAETINALTARIVALEGV